MTSRDMLCVVLNLSCKILFVVHASVLLSKVQLKTKIFFHADAIYFFKFGGGGMIIFYTESTAAFGSQY